MLTRHSIPLYFAEECLLTLHEILFNAKVSLRVVGGKILQLLHEGLGDFSIGIGEL